MDCLFVIQKRIRMNETVSTGTRRRTSFFFVRTGFLLIVVCIVRRRRREEVIMNQKMRNVTGVSDVPI